jgi:hypothetical protein
MTGNTLIADIWWNQLSVRKKMLVYNFMEEWAIKEKKRES